MFFAHHRSTTGQPHRGSVTLLCPHVLAPLPMPSGQTRVASLLQRLLARADQSPSAETDPLAALLRAAGCRWPTDAEVPSAAVALLGEGMAVAADTVWMHADPVHLRPDRAQLRVYAGAQVAPNPAEAAALVAAFNQHFAEEGVALIAPVPERWYLRLTPARALVTHPLYRVQGESMADYLPQGADARAWMRLLNETQMLFHAAAVNRQREAAGRPLINGIWTWGAGILPQIIADQIPEQLIGEGPLLAGLATLTGCKLSRLAEWQAAIPTAGTHCIVWNRHWHAWLARDVIAWDQATIEFEALIQQLWDALRAGHLATVRLDPNCGSVFTITRRQTWRVWR